MPNAIGSAFNAGIDSGLPRTIVHQWALQANLGPAEASSLTEETMLAAGLAASHVGPDRMDAEVGAWLRGHFIEQWICRQEGLISAWARKDVGQREDAEDLTQETLAKATQKKDQFRGSQQGQMRRWLRTIYVSQLSEWSRWNGALKRDKRRERPLVEATKEQARQRAARGLPPDGEGSDIPSGHTTPSEAACRNEDYDDLEAALSRLSEQERATLIQSVCEGKSLRVIAEGQGLTVGQVSIQRARALRKLALVRTSPGM